MNQSSAQRNSYMTLPDGRTAGALVGGDLVKRVQGSKHKLRSRPGWAVDAAMLREARSRGVTQVRIEDVESGRVYLTDCATLDAFGYSVNFGFGDQVGLDMKHWRQPGQAEQLDLFAA